MGGSTFRGLAAAALSFLSIAAAMTYGGTPAHAEDLVNIPIQETGRVVKILDGDTIIVQTVDGRRMHVRMLGINAPETVSPNKPFTRTFCGGDEATQYLSRVLPVGAPVQMRAQNSESTGRGRPLRYVFGWNDATQQYDVDVQAMLAREGWVMWFPARRETWLSRNYRVLVDQARAEKRGIWNPEWCGPIDQPLADIDLRVAWDAPGPDRSNLNGEYVVVRNSGPVPVDLSGWLLRDSSLQGWFYFPAGTVLLPGDWRVVRVGSGTPSGRDLYMGLSKSIFPNPGSGEQGRFLGDAVYLLDRNTAIRSMRIYPCAGACAKDPLAGVVAVESVEHETTRRNPGRAAQEQYLTVRNSGDEAVLLDGYFLQYRNWSYVFPPGTEIPAGGLVTVTVGRGSDVGSSRFWGFSRPVLASSGSVRLMSMDNVSISRKSW